MTKQTIYKLMFVKYQQILHFFPNSDKLNRNFKLVGNGQHRVHARQVDDDAAAAVRPRLLRHHSARGGLRTKLQLLTIERARLSAEPDLFADAP
jgi:hypothetical protein